MKEIFKYSSKSIPSKTEKFKAMVKATALNVRTWTGAEYSTCSFSPLYNGTIISVCDSIYTKDKKLWYYIKYNNKYGFINSSYVNRLADKQYTFLTCLEDIHKLVQNNSAYFKYSNDNNNINTVEDLKMHINKKQIVTFNCAVPMKLAYNKIGLVRSNGSSLLYALNGSFQSTFTGSFATTLKRIINGKVIGKTVKEAVDEQLLIPGDTICFENLTHTFTYTGNKYDCYDGGHESIKNGKYTGIKANYKNNQRLISEIIRWEIIK